MAVAPSGEYQSSLYLSLPVLVSRLLEKTPALKSLIEILTVSKKQLVALVVEQQQDIRKLSEKVSNPITDTIDSNPKVETLLVGTSSLRDVHFHGPDNRSQIRVVNKSGATFKEIEQMFDEDTSSEVPPKPWATPLQTTSATKSAVSEISRTISEAQQRHPNETADHRYTATKYVERPAPKDLRGKQRHFRRQRQQLHVPQRCRKQPSIRK